MDPEEPRPLQVAVMGAGAVGCYYGAMLARAGQRVTLIGRASHVQAVQALGLRLNTAAFDEHVGLAASTDPAAAAGADLVLLAVKSNDTEAAAQALRPHLRPDALVLCLQNGVDNAQRVRSLLPGQPVAAAVVYVAVAMAGPGHVRHHGRGELLIEQGPWLRWLLPAWAAAGVPAEGSDDVQSRLWAKLVINCTYNALSALGAMPYGSLVQQPGVADLMAELVAECRAVAAAEGVPLPADLDAMVRGIAQTMATQLSSTAQDLQRGRPTEIDHLNGHIVQRAAVWGVPVPANRALWLAVRLVQARAQGGLPAKTAPEGAVPSL